MKRMRHPGGEPGPEPRRTAIRQCVAGHQRDPSTPRAKRLDDRAAAQEPDTAEDVQVLFPNIESHHAALSDVRDDLEQVAAAVAAADHAADAPLVPSDRRAWGTRALSSGGGRCLISS